MSAPALELAFRAQFGEFELDVAIESTGASLGIFGPSGAGKTSLLEVLAGWRRPGSGRAAAAGRVLFDVERGLDEPIERRGIGYVPQDGLLFPHWSVGENLAAGVRRGRADPRHFERVVAVLELGALLARDVASLSGGERQRVALGRALCSAPALLLLDEPLASLDLALRRRILPYLLRAREEFGVPLVFVSHDFGEVQALCDEVVVLERGRVRARGSPSELFAALGPDVLPEVETILRGRVVGLGAGTAEVELAPGVRVVLPGGGLARGDDAVFALRADDALLALEPPAGISARNVLPARVRSAAPRGDDVLVLADLGGPATPPVAVLVTVAAAAELALAPGRAVHLIVKTRSLRTLAELPSRA